MFNNLPEKVKLVFNFHKIPVVKGLNPDKHGGVFKAFWNCLSRGHSLDGFYNYVPPNPPQEKLIKEGKLVNV